MRPVNSPIQSAIALLNRLGSSEPSDMTMEEIAWSCGLVVKFKEMAGSQARILMNEKDGIITINNAITYQPKINYILAHEIGHSQLHRHLCLFDDNDSTLSDWYAQGPHEKEANLFAAELLMPGELFKRKVRNKKLDITLIEETGDFFGASKTATFLRYKDLGPYPAMIIFIEKGIIKWKSCSQDFPYQWLILGNRLPAFTVAGDYYYRQVEEKKPARISAIEWFPDDFNCQRAGDKAKLWEQSFPSSSDTIVTCLWPA